MERLKSIVISHKDLFTVLGLGILFYFLFFHNIWSYALMDVDETRYVSMSKDMFNTKDFLTLYLNNEFFFEKPPLYFWGECLSFAIFGKINELTARFPVALYGTMCGFLTYFVGKKIVSRLYGVVSALILATSLEFLILAKFAILDIVLTTCVWFSLCFGILTFFAEDKNKKYFWWLFYIFSALGVLAKGIPGFVIPFGSMFFMSLFFKQFKEIFKPQYFLPGILIFLAITLPWHIVMLKMHNPLFFDEYIIKHHLTRFLGGNDLGREQPFYFYILTILWGFIPWIFSTLSVLIKRIIKKELVFKNLNSSQKFLMLNGIIAIFTLLFFSSSDTKLITYILPIYGSLAFLGGYIWKQYIEDGVDSKIINITAYIFGGILLLASVVAIFCPLYLPKQLLQDISGVKVFVICLIFATGLASILFAKKNIRLGLFATYVVFMLILSAFGTGKLFEVDYKFGQNDLLEFANYAKENNKKITTYQFSHKYSLIYYGGKPVNYGLEYDIPELKKELAKDDTVVIIPRKKLNDEILNLKYNLIGEGRKYILVE